jgi:hypothetical protein
MLLLWPSIIYFLYSQLQGTVEELIAVKDLAYSKYSNIYWNDKRLTFGYFPNTAALLLFFFMKIFPFYF